MAEPDGGEEDDEGAAKRERHGAPALRNPQHGDGAATGVEDEDTTIPGHGRAEDDEAGIGEEDDTILLIADLFVYLLTGTIAAEPSLASTTALLDRITHHCDIVETGNDSWRFKHRS